MSVSNFDDLSYHVGHEFECVFYGDKERNWNVSLECMTCCEVIVGFDSPEVEQIESNPLEQKGE